MAQFDSPDQAKAIADQALSRMADLGLAPHPEIFALWFSYCAGRDAELTEAVNDALRSAGHFDDRRCMDLHERFFGLRGREDALAATGKQVDDAIGRVLDHVARAIDGSRRYGQSVIGHAERLMEGRSPEQLRRHVADIVSETKKAVERNRALEGQLSRTGGEIATLRRGLDRSRHRTVTDALTGIANRRGFELALGECAAEADAQDLPLSLLLIDIDNFKRFNDFFGHMMGDQVIRLVAHGLTRAIKGGEHACRYGGEEFAIILPMTPLSSACLVAENIRRRIAKKNIVNKANGKVLSKITISVGVAEYRCGEPLDDLVRRADGALQRAKRNGRDRIAS